MIYLLENSEKQWFKGFSYDKTKVNTIAELELTTDVNKAWQFSHRHDAEDYINEQTHRLFTSQEFLVAEHEIVENSDMDLMKPIPEEDDAAEMVPRDSTDLHTVFMNHFGLKEDEVEVEVWNTIKRLSIAIEAQPESPLQRPAKYGLKNIFKELKFGRPSEDQKFLQKCIDKLDNDKTPISEKAP